MVYLLDPTLVQFRQHTKSLDIQSHPQNNLYTHYNVSLLFSKEASPPIVCRGSLRRSSSGLTALAPLSSSPRPWWTRKIILHFRDQDIETCKQGIHCSSDEPEQLQTKCACRGRAETQHEILSVDLNLTDGREADQGGGRGVGLPDIGGRRGRFGVLGMEGWVSWLETFEFGV